MASVPALKEQDQGEREVFNKTFRKWSGVFTRAARTSIPEDAWYNLENLQPIGDANLHVVPNLSASLHDFAADNIYAGGYANLNNVDYIFFFGASGKIYQYRISNGVVTVINPTTLLSGVGSQMDQWMNLAVLFSDSTGYYSWDGTTFTKIVVAGAPSSADAIAVYANRVWIAKGRVLFFSVAAFQNAANTGYGNNAGDWTAANGSGFVVLTDPQIRSGVVRMISANGYLYILSLSAINVIADVYVPTGASPPTPIFTNLNIQGIIGTIYPWSVFPFNRSLMFANQYGAYSLDGTTATKISDDIDGTWQYLDPAQPISGGQVVVNNILTAGFLIKRLNDPIFGSNQIGAMWWDGKWWFLNNGALTFVCSAMVSGNPALFGLIGNQLYQLCAQFTTPPNTAWRTPLWDMGDAARKKQMIRAGVEIDVFSPGMITLNADGVNSSTPVSGGANFSNVNWVNNSGAVIPWKNNSNVIIPWFNPTSQLYASGAPGVFDRYLGLSGASTGANFQLANVMFDYEFSQRFWS